MRNSSSRGGGLSRHPNKPTKHHPRGIIIINEMFAVLLLVVAAMLLGTRIFVEIVRQTRELPEAERVMIQQQSLLTEFRRDVWASQAVTPIDGGVLLDLGDGDRVTWTADANAITRGVDRQWKDVGEVSIRIDGPVVTLVWPTAEVRCVSQVLLAKGGPR